MQFPPIIPEKHESCARQRSSLKTIGHPPYSDDDACDGPASTASLLPKPALRWSSLEKKPDVIGARPEPARRRRHGTAAPAAAKSEIPVIIHSNRSDEIERIIGIEIGADDLPAQTLQHARTALPAFAPAVAAPSKTVSPTTRQQARRLRFGQWTLDTASRELIDE